MYCKVPARAQAYTCRQYGVLCPWNFLRWIVEGSQLCLIWPYTMVSTVFRPFLHRASFVFSPPLDCSDCFCWETMRCTSIFVIGVISMCVSVARFNSTAPVQGFICNVFANSPNVHRSKLAVFIHECTLIQTWETCEISGVEKEGEYKQGVRKGMPKRDSEECPSWKTMSRPRLPSFSATICSVLQASPIFVFVQIFCTATYNVLTTNLGWANVNYCTLVSINAQWPSGFNFPMPTFSIILSIIVSHNLCLWIRKAWPCVEKIL